MFARLRVARLRLLLVALHALAAATVGAMPAMAAPAARPDLSAFALPGQSAPVLCLTGDPQGHDEATPHDRCAACILIAAAGTGNLPAIDVTVARTASAVFYGNGTGTAAWFADIRPASRGPPATGL
jgi:hypothetical protein